MDRVARSRLPDLMVIQGQVAGNEAVQIMAGRNDRLGPYLKPAGLSLDFTCKPVRVAGIGLYLNLRSILSVTTLYECSLKDV